MVECQDVMNDFINTTLIDYEKISFTYFKTLYDTLKIRNLSICFYDIDDLNKLIVRNTLNINTPNYTREKLNRTYKMLTKDMLNTIKDDEEDRMYFTTYKYPDQHVCVIRVYVFTRDIQATDYEYEFKITQKQFDILNK